MLGRRRSDSPGVSASHGLEGNLTRFGDAGQSSIEKTCRTELALGLGP